MCTIILIIVVSNDNYPAAPSSQLSSAMMRSRKPPVCLNFWPRAAETDTNLPRKRRQDTLPRSGAALGTANTRFLTPMNSNCIAILGLPPLTEPRPLPPPYVFSPASLKSCAVAAAMLLFDKNIRAPRIISRIISGEVFG